MLPYYFDGQTHEAIQTSWGRSFLIGKKQDALIEFSRSVLDGRTISPARCLIVSARCMYASTPLDACSMPARSNLDRAAR